jgi:hypothetical protein
MKKITLLAAIALLITNTVSAFEGASFSTENKNRFSFDEPISFTERGIEFFIFANGDFDFNTAPSDNDDIMYKNGRRNANQTFGTHYTPANSGVRIEHDAHGRIRRIGNVFVNYDGQNRIKRIGSVYMTYNQVALTRVGNLRIIYNRRGQIVNVIGNVKGSNNFENSYNSGTNFEGNQAQTPDDRYYRTNGADSISDRKNTK